MVVSSDLLKHLSCFPWVPPWTSRAEMVPSKEHDHKEELFERPRKRRSEVCVGLSLGQFQKSGDREETISEGSEWERGR